MKLLVLTLIYSSSLWALDFRPLDIPADWNIINCKQLENGGISFWKEKYPDSTFAITSLSTQSETIYEITIDGEWRASCRFVSIMK